MSHFKAKMHQIPFRLGLRPRPQWGAYSAPPDLLAGFKGPTSKGREGSEGKEERQGKGEGKVRGGDRKGREGRDGKREGGEEGEKGRGKRKGSGDEEGEGRYVSPFLKS